ncbi:hypothetical protein GGI07_002930 [Coemansia sp. Benny D115]|nr:hypothetical protein GGI07_002930 [Coemansia sp. Benny D115]
MHVHNHNVTVSLTTTEPSVVFCSKCQRNQELVRQILASYLPDEEDPEYEERLDNADQYAEQLRRRYPLVCGACQGRVDQQLQRQAQWVHRRQLADALERSARGHRGRPVLRPTLRRKGSVVAWILGALAAVACTLAMWSWYLASCGLSTLYSGPVGALVLALVTYWMRLLNPMWLRLARRPEMRVSGLPLYHHRTMYLALLRALAACTAVAGDWNAAVFAIFGVADLALCWFTLGALSVRSGLRRNRRAGTAPTAASNTTTKHGGGALHEEELSERDLAGDTQQALASLQGLSFGASEANRDQDDSLFGLESLGMGSNQSPWTRNLQPTGPRRRRVHRNPLSSGSSNEEEEEEFGAGDDALEPGHTGASALLSGLGTLSMGPRSPRTNKSVRRTKDPEGEAMDVDLAQLLGGLGSNSGSAARNAQRSASQGMRPEPKPFAPFVFHRQHTTGLEHRMSAFSIHDSDDEADGSYQGLFGSRAMDSRLLAAVARLASIQGVAIIGLLCTWTAARWLPLWAIWLQRCVLLAAVVAATKASDRSLPPVKNTSVLQRPRSPFGQSTGRPSAAAASTAAASKANHRMHSCRAIGALLAVLLAILPVAYALAAQDPVVVMASGCGWIDLALARTLFARNPLILLRWPLAKQSAGMAVQGVLLDLLATPSSKVLAPAVFRDLPLLINLDYAVETACLVFLAGAQ